MWRRKEDDVNERKEFEGAITEITAGKVLGVKSEVDQAWNNASDRAIRIIKQYIDGKGLFQ
jgi:hypothetical protein